MTESSSFGDHLGCPIIDSCVTKETFGKFLSKSVNTSPKWKANALSQAGRTVLIQANLATKANFWIQNFKLPKVILNSLDKKHTKIYFGIKTWIVKDVNL